VRSSLQLRVLLTYGYLAGLVIAAAATAALGFHGLGERLTRAVSERSESTRTAAAMLDALDRQERALRDLRDQPEHHLQNHAKLLKARDDFKAALERLDRRSLEEASDSDPGVRADSDPMAVALTRIAAIYGGYRHDEEETLAQLAIGVAADQVTLPDAGFLRRCVLELLAHDDQILLDMESTLQDSARQRAVLFGLLAALALISFGVLSRTLRSHLLQRLAALAEVARAVAAGDRRRRAMVDREDELGVVARQLNAALDAQQGQAATQRGRIAEDRELLLAILAAWRRPAALLGSNGSLRASTLDEAVTRELEAGRGLTLEPGETLELGGCRLHLQALRGPRGGIVGYLAEGDAAAEPAAAVEGTAPT
jgi:HAMP domain-containing protein